MFDPTDLLRLVRPRRLHALPWVLVLVVASMAACSTAHADWRVTCPVAFVATVAMVLTFAWYRCAG